MWRGTFVERFFSLNGAGGHYCRCLWGGKLKVNMIGRYYSVQCNRSFSFDSISTLQKSEFWGTHTCIGDNKEGPHDVSGKRKQQTERSKIQNRHHDLISAPRNCDNFFWYFLRFQHFRSLQRFSFSCWGVRWVYHTPCMLGMKLKYVKSSLCVLLKISGMGIEALLASLCGNMLEKAASALCHRLGCDLARQLMVILAKETMQLIRSGKTCKWTRYN